MGRKTNSEDSIPLEKKCYHKMNLRIKSFDLPSHRLLRDSHLDLEIETLKENSRLILVLNSQFCCENSHSHSQLSLSSSQKFEKSRLNLVDFVIKFLTFHYNSDASIIQISILIGCSCATTKTKTNPKTKVFVRSG